MWSLLRNWRIFDIHKFSIALGAITQAGTHGRVCLPERRYRYYLRTGPVSCTGIALGLPKHLSCVLFTLATKKGNKNEVQKIPLQTLYTICFSNATEYFAISARRIYAISSGSSFWWKMVQWSQAKRLWLFIHGTDKNDLVFYRCF